MRIHLLALPLALAGACGQPTSDPPGDAAADAGGPDAPSTTVTLTLLDRDGRPGGAHLVAYQDGDGAWLPLTGAQGVYRAYVTAEHYGLLVGCAGPEQTPENGVHLTFSTVAEATDVTMAACGPTTGATEVRGALRNVVPMGTVTVHGLDRAFGSVDGAMYEMFVWPGRQQLLVTEHGDDDARRIVRRDLGEVTVDRVEDVDLATGLPPRLAPATLTGLGPGDILPYGQTTILTAGSELPLPFIAVTEADASYRLLAEQQVRAGDRVAVTIHNSSITPSNLRTLTVIDVEPGETFALPPARPIAGPTELPAGLRWTLPGFTLVDGERLGLYLSNGLTSMAAETSPGWALGNRALEPAEMSQVDGWEPGWTLDGNVYWRAAIDRVEADRVITTGRHGFAFASTRAPRVGPRPVIDVAALQRAHGLAAARALASPSSSMSSTSRR